MHCYVTTSLSGKIMSADFFPLKTDPRILPSLLFYFSLRGVRTFQLAQENWQTARTVFVWQIYTHVPAETMLCRRRRRAATSIFGQNLVLVENFYNFRLLSVVARVSPYRVTRKLVTDQLVATGRRTWIRSLPGLGSIGGTVSAIPSDTAILSNYILSEIHFWLWESICICRYSIWK